MGANDRFWGWVFLDYRMATKSSSRMILGWHPLKTQYPIIYNISHRKQMKIVEVLCTTPVNVTFRRAIVGNKPTEWHNLVARVANLNLQHASNVFVWFCIRMVFFVYSMYRFVVNNGIQVSQIVWKLKIRKYFFCSKRGHSHKKTIYQIEIGMVIRLVVFVCSKLETMHSILLYECIYAWFLWRAVHMVLGLKPPKMFKTYLISGIVDVIILLNPFLFNVRQCTRR